MVLPAANQFLLPNRVVYSESVFAAKIALFEANQHSLPKLRCLQRISIRCRKCVFYSEYMIHCRNWAVRSELAFAAESVLAIANQRSLSKLCCLQRISVRCRKCVFYSESVICCRNWVVCSELAFTTKIELSAANLLKVCVLQRIYDSLSKLSYQQRISIRCRKCIGCSELAFTAKNVLATVNQRSLSKLCCLQRISVRNQKCVVYSEFVIHCQNWVVCGELAFAVEMLLSAANQCPLLKVCCFQWICDSLSKLSCLQRISVRCKKCCSTANLWFATEI